MEFALSRVDKKDVHEARILIIDDIETNRLLLKTVLLNDGFKYFYEAEDGGSALRLLDQQEVDLILLDLLMPGMDGFEFLREVKGYKDQIPVLVVSAKTDPVDVKKAFELGAMDYLRKPFEPVELVMRVRNWIKFYWNKKDLEKAVKMLKRMAMTDSLTGLYNHAHLISFLDREITRCLRYGRKGSFMLADIDNFKKINDELGHIAGDTVLESLAELFEKNVRSIDIIGRYGGEEFGFILPETDSQQSRVIGERIRKAVEEKTFKVESFGEILKLKLTISIGISTFPMTGSDTSRTVIQSTDLALYRAKSLGKNRVVHFDDLREQL